MYVEWTDTFFVAVRFRPRADSRSTTNATSFLEQGWPIAGSRDWKAQFTRSVFVVT